MTTIVSIAQGGTGANSAAAARNTLGAAANTGGVFTGAINVATANITTIVTGNALTLSTGTASNGNIIFSANGSEDMRITNTGFIGIFTSTPNSNLTVVGNVWATTGVNAATVNASTVNVTSTLGGGSTLTIQPNVTISQSLTVTGNLIVSGSSTTLNTEILIVEDADIVLLSNVTGTPVLNSGITVNRGTSTNTFLRWSEDGDRWGWTDDGTTFYSFDNVRNGLVTTNTTFATINTTTATMNTATTNRVLKAGDTMTGNLIVSGATVNTATANITTIVTGNNLTLSTGAASNGEIIFSSNNNEDMRIVANGFIGIGTATPASRIHAYGTSGATTIIAEGATNSAAYGRLELRGRPAAADHSTGYVVAASTLGGQSPTIVGSIDFASVSGTGNSHYIALSTHNGTALGERMRIVANGWVGIGTNSPATTLHVDASGGGIVRVSRLGTGAGIMQMEADGTDGALSTTNNLRFQTASTERMRIASGGNVGIGTNNPLQLFVVSNAGAAGFEFVPSSGIMQTYNRSTSAYSNMRFDANQIDFYTGSSVAQRMLLDSSGNLFLNAFSGRGGGSTGYLFKLNPGKVYFELMANNTTSTSDILFTDGAAGAYGIVGYDHSNDSLRIYTNSAWRMTIDSSGNVGIGTTSMSYLLHVNGTSYFNGNVQGTAFHAGGRDAPYTSISETSSGAMSVFGHNARANTSAANRITAPNSSYHSHFIRMYYSDGIVFTTSTGIKTAGDILYDANSALIVSGTAERMRIDTGGNVGIGTASPARKVHISDSSSPHIRLHWNGSAAAGNKGLIEFHHNRNSDGTQETLGYIQGVAEDNQSAGGIRFVARNNADVEAFRITSAGKVGIGTSSFNTNGGVLQVSNGISFPATQSACSDANTLDDYEEGTFTVTLVGSGSNPTVTYGAQGGKYTKIGDKVYFNLYVSPSAYSGGSGNLDILGLPFTSAGGGVAAPPQSGWTSSVNFPTGYTQFSPIVIYGDTRIWCTVCGDNVGYTRLVVSDMVAGAEIRISGCYYV